MSADPPQLFRPIRLPHAKALADKTIKYRPEASVLKLGIGDEITLDTARFRQLLDEFLAEIERRFPDGA